MVSLSNFEHRPVTIKCDERDKEKVVNLFNESSEFMVFDLSKQFTSFIEAAEVPQDCVIVGIEGI